MISYISAPGRDHASNNNSLTHYKQHPALYCYYEIIYQRTYRRWKKNNNNNINYRFTISKCIVDTCVCVCVMGIRRLSLRAWIWIRTNNDIFTSPATLSVGMTKINQPQRDSKQHQTEDYRFGENSVFPLRRAAYMHLNVVCEMATGSVSISTIMLQFRFDSAIIVSAMWKLHL